jgi:hypothetical protein
MQRMNRLMSLVAGELLRLLYGLLRFLRQFVESECHCLLSSFS